MSLIAQYIENYLDLVENSPNDIIRQITRLHEKNQLYSKLTDKLEEVLKILIDNGSTEFKSSSTTDKSKNSSGNLNENENQINKNEKKTIDKQLSDKLEQNKDQDTSSNKAKSTKEQSNKEKLHKDQQLLNQDTAKEDEEDENVIFERQKALNSVKRYLLEIQEIADEKLNIVQSILEHLDCKNKQLDLDYRSLSSQQNTNLKSNSNSSSQNTNDEDSLSGNQENSNNELNYPKEDIRLSTTTTAAVVVQSNQSSTVNNHHSSNSKRASSRRNMSSGKQEFNSTDLNSSHNGSNSNNNGYSSSNHKRGVKRGGVNKNSNNKEIKRNRSSSSRDLANSPSNLYDDAPIDPDEPTYCVCEQVSFGEMICCDNSACVIEWFHFSCVSLSTKPKGKWYCPTCRNSLKCSGKKGYRVDRTNITKK